MDGRSTHSFSLSSLAVTLFSVYFFLFVLLWGFFASCTSVIAKADIYFKYSDDTAILSILLGNSDSLLVYKQSSSDSSWSVSKIQVKSYK